MFLVYLLDDILSSLDNVIANHIIKHCILGLLRYKTRIIVTENKILCNHATQVLRIENGCVSPSPNSFNQSDDIEMWNESIESSTDSNMEIVDMSDNQSLDSVMDEVRVISNNFSDSLKIFLCLGITRIRHIIHKSNFSILEINRWLA